MNANFESLCKELENYEPNPSDLQREKRKQLLMGIVSDWESEEDVDYSIPLSTLTCMLEESASYLDDFSENRDRLNRISERTDSAPHFRNAQRIL